VTTVTAPSQRVPLVASLMAVSAGVVWALGVITVRLADHTDAYQYLIWRSTGVVVVSETISRVRRRGWMLPRAFNQGRMMLIGCVGLFLASLAYVYALKNTTSANAAFLASVTPLFAVVMARFFLGERLSRVTLGAVALAFTGLIVIVLGDLRAGNMAGNVAALISSLGFAGYTICVRSEPNRDWSPILPGYGFIMIVVCSAVTLANGRTVFPPAADMVYAMVHGGIFIVAGTLLFNAGSRHIPAVPMTVFAQSETVLVPVFVLLWFGDVPKALTLLGGAIIVAAVIGKAVLDARPVRDEMLDHPIEPGPGSIA
jgi:drug/metabolite transporter, DME family